jgi:Zn-dependent protease/CBS domain-containing protein
VSWSWTVFRFKGIDVKIHITFVLILLWAAYYWGAATGRGAQGAIFGVVATVLLFACVTLHEFGHSLVAMSYGVKVRDITLFPLGGLARMEEIPRNPRQELAVSLAGPAVNLVIAGVLIVTGVILNARAVISLPHLVDALQRAEWSGMLVYLAMANLLLGLFNLIPAFPMDGGRVLRALLAMRLDYNQATLVAARIGQALALAFGFIAFAIGDWILILIAVFVWFGAAGEQRQTDTRSIFGDATVAQFMTREPHTLSRRDSLAQAVELVLTTSQTDFPVLEPGNGQMIGMLTSDGLFRALRAHPDGNVLATAAQLARPVVVPPDERLTKAQERMVMSGVRSVAVVDSAGVVVGLLTERDIAEGYRFLAAGGATVLLPH